MGDLRVFGVAAVSPLCRKLTLRHQVGKQFLVSLVRSAQDIVESLRRKAVLISIPVLLRAWQGYFTIICVGNPRDQPPRSGKRNGLKNVLNFFQHPLLYQSVYLFMGGILRVGRRTPQFDPVAD